MLLYTTKCQLNKLNIVVSRLTKFTISVDVSIALSKMFLVGYQ